MPDLGQDRTNRDVLAALPEHCEPLTTAEVVERVDRPPEAVSTALEGLAERGLVASKRVGGALRVWWRPPADPQPPATASTAGEATATSPPTSEPGDVPTGVPVEELLRASPISVAVFDRSGDVSFANERAEELLGLEPAEGTERRYATPEWHLAREDGSPIPPSEHPITRVFETGEPSFGFEHWVTFPDGTERWVWGNATPIARDGTVEHVVVGFADVTVLKEREERLTSDRRRRLELSSPQLFGPFLDAADGSFRVDVDEVVPLSDGTVLEYFAAEGLTAKALSDILQEDDTVESVRLRKSKGDSCRLERRVTPPTLPTVFEEYGGEVRTLVERTASESALVAELPGDVDPREAIEAAREVCPDLELVSQELRYSPRLLSDIVQEALTERKFAALQTAYHSGYFETPRRSSGDELAEQLGITRQTFNQHLRKAEQRVLEQLFEAAPSGEH